MLTYPRYIPLALVPEEFMGFGGSDYAALSQNVAGISAGQMYFMTAQVTLPPSTASCMIQFSTGAENLLSFDYGLSAQNGAVNASGIFKYAPSTITLSVYCSDYSGGSATINTWAAFDNIQLSVYNPPPARTPFAPSPWKP
jgi:hypothetical protein